MKTLGYTLYLIGVIIICSIIGVSLPLTINAINGIGADHWYGTFASYAMSILLGLLFMKDAKITPKKEVKE